MLTIQDIEHEINQALIKMDGPNAASTILLSRHEALAVIHYLHENMNLRTERVQLQDENESLRADLREVQDTLTHVQNEQKGVFGEPPAWQDKTDVEVLAERLAKVEDRLAAAHSRITYVADIIGQRIAELVEKTGGTTPGYEPEQRPPLTPEQRDTFGRGDAVRLDMAQSQGGRRLFGWYVVEAIRADSNGYTVQVSAPERADPKPLFWIKPEDVLEVRHPTP